uniref:NB-ARC domain-containing protein n=1 Tax=Leersia perrieri TaxID=77586 RepID=A0A0D9W4G9_9ORYZ
MHVVASRLNLELLPHVSGDFDHVIKVQLIQPGEDEEFVMSLKNQLTAAVVEELGLVDQEYHRIKRSLEEKRSFHCDLKRHDVTKELRNWLERDTVSARINSTLSNKRYLLVVENMYEPIRTSDFTNQFGLPRPSRWTSSGWLIFTTSQEVYNKSKSEDDVLQDCPNNDDIMMFLTLVALHLTAKHICKVVGQKDDEEYWHRITLRCFHYALLLFPQRHEPADANKNNYVITKDELIRHWDSQGFLTTTSKSREDQDNFSTSSIRRAYQVGNTILEAFQEYSLLKLPYYPATEAEEATKTATHFLLFHGLVTNHLTKDEISHEERWFQNKRWIKLGCNQEVEDQGWHISTKWQSKEEESGWESAMMDKIILVAHPTLKSFLLINAPHIKKLSLHGCRKLENVELRELGALEDLDLSATSIKELPADIPNLPQLRRLLLMGVPFLRRFPWHSLERFPDVFHLDHCTKVNDNNYDDQVSHLSRKVAYLCVEDSTFFYSFTDETRCSVERGKFFQSLYVQIAPCTVNIRRLEDEHGILANKLQELAQKKSVYGDVYCHYMTEEVSVVSTTRHVEMFAIDRYPDGLRCLLDVVKSISMTEDTFVSCLSNLSDLYLLEDCTLRLCHRMKHVFHNSYVIRVYGLRNAWVSQLKGLIHFHTLLNEKCVCSFYLLKHLHLEYCPRLESIMGIGSGLQNLTTLHILFCYNLKTIFHQHFSHRDISDLLKLPELQMMRLQELPLLEHFDDGVDAVTSAPAWKDAGACAVSLASTQKIYSTRWR